MSALVQLLPCACMISVMRWPLPTPGVKMPVPEALDVSFHSLKREGSGAAFALVEARVDRENRRCGRHGERERALASGFVIEGKHPAARFLRDVHFVFAGRSGDALDVRGVALAEVKLGFGQEAQAADLLSQGGVKLGDANITLALVGAAGAGVCFRRGGGQPNC